METLSTSGLQDPHSHMVKELDSWDIWNVEEADRKADLRTMCQQWLDRYVRDSFNVFLGVGNGAKGDRTHVYTNSKCTIPNAPINIDRSLKVC